MLISWSYILQKSNHHKAAHYLVPISTNPRWKSITVTEYVHMFIGSLNCYNVYLNLAACKLYFPIALRTDRWTEEEGYTAKLLLIINYQKSRTFL